MLTCLCFFFPGSDSCPCVSASSVASSMIPDNFLSHVKYYLYYLLLVFCSYCFSAFQPPLSFLSHSSSSISRLWWVAKVETITLMEPTLAVVVWLSPDPEDTGFSLTSQGIGPPSCQLQFSEADPARRLWTLSWLTCFSNSRLILC